MAVAAVGIFDGVHLGHRSVIETLVGCARERSDKSIVITFHPHPRTVLQDGADSLRLLSSRSEKEALLRSLGVDEIVELPFTRELASEKAFVFLDILKSDYAVSTLVLGYDTRMGSDQIGTDGLTILAGEKGIETVRVGALGEDFISSSKIRTALLRGDVKAAAAMLGRPYSLSGVVVSGNRLGTKLGFPTANMQLYEPLRLIPANGVYFVEVSTGGSIFYGMTNIGYRPTLGGGNALTIETNIFDFSELIYGLDISVSFIERIRDEVRFPSLDALKEQLREDERECRSMCDYV